jgi:segregation and condensation protein B
MLLNPENIKNIIEAALMAAGQPLSIDRLLTLFLDEQQPSRDEIRGAIKILAEQCENRGVELTEVSSGFRYQAKQDYAQWVARLWEEKPPRYSRALLETLSLIAYRQPITRGEIEDVRGVSVSTNIVRTLLERDWVKVVGHRDVPGKPAMYATTRQFLDYFNLKNLSDLPTLAEIRDIDSINAELDLVEPGTETDVDASSDTDADTNADANADANADTTEQNEAGSASIESVDLAANDAPEEMASMEENEFDSGLDLDPKLDSDIDPELESRPPMEETTELKAAPVADTA